MIQDRFIKATSTVLLTPGGKMDKILDMMYRIHKPVAAKVLA
jgi:hypothetical protein